MASEGSREEARRWRAGDWRETTEERRRRKRAEDEGRSGVVSRIE